MLGLKRILSCVNSIVSTAVSVRGLDSPSVFAQFIFRNNDFVGPLTGNTNGKTTRITAAFPNFGEIFHSCTKRRV